MTGKFEIKAQVSNSKNGQRIAKMLQNLLDSVEEKNLLDLCNMTESNPKYFSKVVKIIDKPVIKKLFN